MEIKIWKERKLYYVTVGALFLLMVLFTRAMLLGNISQIIGLVFGLACLVLNLDLRIGRKSIVLLVSCFAFFTYCLISGIINDPGDRTKLIVQIFIYWVLFTFAAACVLGRKNVEKSFGRLLTVVLIACTISYLISFALGMTIGWDRIKLFMLDYKYEYISPVYLPFTPTYGDITFSSFKIPRMLSIGREVGISQMFYIWAYFRAGDFFKKTRFVKIFLAIGVFCCLSATGLVIFVALLVFEKITGFKKVSDKIRPKDLVFYILPVLIVVFAVFLLMRGGNLSLATRMDISYSERSKAFDFAYQEFIKNPLFGSGFMKEYSSTDVQAGIAFLSSVGSVGLIGFILFINIYLQALLRAEDKRKFILCNASFLITTLLAQPVYTSAVIYIFLFCDYSKTGNVKAILKKLES